VRDLIYAGRLPSLRVGRLHYIKASDLKVERRRRLGLPLPRARVPRTERAPRHLRHDAPRADPQLRRQRAAERAMLVSRWAERHKNISEPELPFAVLGVTTPTSCESCGREVRRGRIVEVTADEDPNQSASRLCLACGRRALLDWADRRRHEAARARHLARVA
jgi:hypothetical protein